ncbi:hypothetical protein GCM10010171_34750 [Actinokineospora fastidiosa]|uniref:Uncharacterized protein n=1 Tax=Actinokineospora fastidiosa TaxID=1816 RepID=A0A918GI81_9PSEU|nr:hypothetical protein GCM10010171_34750 [Actinokineospora fastidiosa]
MLPLRLPPRPLWRGLEYGPALVVLDAAGSRPDDIPAAWVPLTDSFQIAWCATPGPETGPEAVEDVLETLADRRVRTHIVADAELAEFAAGVLAEFSHIVRTLVVVGGGDLPATTGVHTARVPGRDLSSPQVVASVLAELGRART